MSFIPRHLLVVSVRPAAKVVLILLWSHASDEEHTGAGSRYVRIDTTTIAKETGLSARTVSRAIDDLACAGLLTILEIEEPGRKEIGFILWPKKTGAA